MLEAPATTGNDCSRRHRWPTRATTYRFENASWEIDGIDLRALFESLGYTGTTPRVDRFLTVTTGAVPADTVMWLMPTVAVARTDPLTLHGATPSTPTDSFFLFQYPSERFKRVPR
jgi:hypothetical protein